MKYNPQKQKDHAIVSVETIQQQVRLLRSCLLNRGMETADGVVEVMRYLDMIETESELAEKHIVNLSQCVLTSHTS